MNEERNKLEKELIAYRKSAGMTPLSGIDLSWIIVFILGDRKRICAPLHDMEKVSHHTVKEELWRIKAVRKLAGLEDGK